MKDKNYFINLKSLFKEVYPDWQENYHNPIYNSSELSKDEQIVLLDLINYQVGSNAWTHIVVGGNYSYNSVFKEIALRYPCKNLSINNFEDLVETLEHDCIKITIDHKNITTDLLLQIVELNNITYNSWILLKEDSSTVNKDIINEIYQQANKLQQESLKGYDAQFFGAIKLIAKHKNTDWQLLLELAKYEKSEVRFAVLNNENINGAILNVLAEDKHKPIRLDVANHPKTLKITLEEKLLNDIHPDVVKATKKRLENM